MAVTGCGEEMKRPALVLEFLSGTAINQKPILTYLDDITPVPRLFTLHSSTPPARATRSWRCL